MDIVDFGWLRGQISQSGLFCQALVCQCNAYNNWRIMLPCMKKITCFAYVKEKHSQTVHEVEVFGSLCTAIRSPLRSPVFYC